MVAVMAMGAVMGACTGVVRDGLGGGARPSEQKTPAPPARKYLGHWQGLTSQGLIIALTVDEDEPTIGLTVLDYEWRLPDCAFHDDVMLEDPAPIGDGQLAVQIEAPGSVLDVAVTFDDAASAHGTLAFMASRIPEQPDCTGSSAISFAVHKDAN
jgi:hypothetical protein